MTEAIGQPQEFWCEARPVGIFRHPYEHGFTQTWYEDGGMSSNMLKSKPLRVLLKISEDRTPKRSGFLIRITQRLQSLDDLGEAPHLKTPLKCPSIFTCHTEDVFLAWLETCPQKQQCGGLPEIWRDLAEDLRGACSIMQHGRQGKSCGISNL